MDINKITLKFEDGDTEDITTDSPASHIAAAILCMVPPNRRDEAKALLLMWQTKHKLEIENIKSITKINLNDQTNN